ncbi:acyl-CoA thioesterase [Mycolicibacterium peregrinum]|uniref:acyl-CoA thioesterase n=1 Tax=Mycolicibacterium peregrinum TaxID=43304 RepID=UPI000AAE9A5A|nr:hypothetical protein [Mycolicibacterium peregrinum]
MDATEFAWKRRSGAPETYEGSVVPGIDLAAMLHDAANDLVAEVFGVTDLKSVAALPVRPVLRSINTVFDSPLRPGAPVLVGATLGSLSRRSFELRTGVWEAQDRRLISHGGVVFVVIDTQLQEAVAVPQNVVDALRSLRPAPDTAAPEPDNQHTWRGTP